MLRMNGQYVAPKALILAFTETCIMVLSVWVAAWARLGAIQESTAYLADPTVAARVALAVAVCLTAFYCGSLYDLSVVARRTELVIRLLQTLGAASLVLALLYSFFPFLMLGRGVFALA